MNKPKKMKRCAYCGAELGMTDSWDRDPESCGDAKCNREVSAMYREEREAAHEQLDRDLGYY